MEWDERLTQESKIRFSKRIERQGGEVIVCGGCGVFMEIKRNPNSRHEECKNCERRRADKGFTRITGYNLEAKESEARRKMRLYYSELNEGEFLNVQINNRGKNGD